MTDAMEPKGNTRLHRCPRKLGHEVGQIDAAAFCVTGVALSASPPGFVWQAWHFHYLHRCPRKLGDEVGQIDAAAFCVAGVALSASPPGFVCQAAGVALSLPP